MAEWEREHLGSAYAELETVRQLAGEGLRAGGSTTPSLPRAASASWTDIGDATGVTNSQHMNAGDRLELAGRIAVAIGQKAAASSGTRGSY